MSTEIAAAPDAERTPAQVHASLLDQLKYELIPMKKTAEKIVELPPNSVVSVTASPVKGPEATLELATLLVEAGHTVVPHLAARTMPSLDELRSVVSELTALGVDEVFVVAGDAEEPAGPWFDAVVFLDHLLVEAPSLSKVGFTAYPDGHSFINHADLSAALHVKQKLVVDAGVAGYVSTQMCFSADKIATWLRGERSAGFVLPVHLGVPGAVERTKLVSMGMRLGVGASLRYLKKNRGVLGSLLGPAYDPNELIGELVGCADGLNIAAVHCFTFNQVASTVAWRQAALAETDR